MLSYEEKYGEESTYLQSSQKKFLNVCEACRPSHGKLKLCLIPNSVNKWLRLSELKAFGKSQVLSVGVFSTRFV